MQRELLRSLGLVRVLDCSTLDFIDGIPGQAEGRGIDVVFSSQRDEVADWLLGLLAPFGRFLDVGGAARKGGATTPANRSLVRIDTDCLVADGPGLIQASIDGVVSLINEGKLRLPTLDLAGEATEETSGWRIRDFAAIHRDVVAVGGGPGRIDPDGSYLITGGFGGFGLELAKWLADRGARHLVLVGRRGAAAREAQQGVQELEARGVRVLAAAADIGEAAVRLKNC